MQQRVNPRLRFSFAQCACVWCNNNSFPIKEVVARLGCGAVAAPFWYPSRRHMFNPKEYSQ